MNKKADSAFYDRADAHITLTNQQAHTAERGDASASMLYASARYNAWIAAMGCESAQHMQAVRGEALEYFVGQYRMMLEDHLDDYIANFATYMQPKPVDGTQA